MEFVKTDLNHSNIKKINVYLVLLILFCGHFLVDFMIGVWPVYKTMAGLDLAKAGLISAACAFLGEGVQVFFGPLSDKGYAKILILAGIFVTTASTLFSYTEDYFLLSLMFLFTCLGSGAFHPSATGVISTLTKEHKGLFITIFASGGALGMASSQIIFSKCHAYANGHTILLAIPTVLLVLVACFCRLSKNVGKTQSGRTKIDFKAYALFFKRKELVCLYMSQVCNQVLVWSTVFLLPDVLVTRGYPDWACYGGAHMFYILGGACMMIPSGYLADRFSSKWVIFTAIAVGFFSFYTFLFTSLPLMFLLPILFLLGACLGVVNPVSVAFGNRLMPSHPGVVSACLMGLVWFVSEGIGQGGGGLLTKLFVEDAPAKALLILGVLFLPGMFFAACLPSNVSDQLEYAQ